MSSKYSICDILKMWKNEAKFNRVVQYTYIEGVLTVYVSSPGVFIGHKGKLISKYKQILHKAFTGFKTVQFVQVEHRWV